MNQTDRLGRRVWLRRILMSTSAAALIGAGMAAPAMAASRVEPKAADQIAQTAATEKAFAIPAQDLSAALLQFREQSGLQVAYESAAIAGAETAGVSGTMTAGAALDRLLLGTSLTFSFTAERTVTITRQKQGDAAQTLEPIVVEGQGVAQDTAQIGIVPAEYAGGQVARGTGLGLLGNRDMMNTPLATSSYTAKTIEDSHAVTAADVLEKDPSVRPSGTKGGILDAFFIRGFPIGEGNLGEVAFNGMFGVAPNYRVMADYAERIEVVKGPSALLNGMSPNSSVGGTINIVPKRATDEPVTNLTLDYAQDTQFGGHVDLGRRSEDGKWGIRVNTSYRDGDTPLDKQEREAFVGAAALDYRGDRFRATIDIVNQIENLDAAVRPYLVASGVLVPDAPGGATNVSQNWAWSKIEDQSVQGRVEYDVTDQITAFAGAGMAKTDVSRLSGQVPFIINAAGDTQATPFYYKFEVDRVTYDAGVRAELQTGAIGHGLSFQVSRYEDELSRGSSSSSSTLFSNIYNPEDSAEPLVSEPGSVPKVSDSALTGLAIADTLSAYDDRAQLTLGARFQTIEANNFNGTTGATTSSYDDDAVTPMVGLLVKPWQHVSLYANYIEGLSRGDIAPSTASNSGEALAPYVATQHEVGVKFDFGNIAAAAALFQIEKPFGQLENGTFSDGGEQRNRGLELSAFGEVTEDVRVYGGVTFFDAELTKTNSAATKGNRPIGVPEMQANISGEWDLPFLEGLTLGGSVIYTGEEYVDTANSQSIDGWTRLDLNGRYAAEVYGTPVIFRATVENVFDEGYWSGVAGSYGGLGLGAPRTVSLSMTAKF